MAAVGGPESVTDAVLAAGGVVGPRSMWAGSWFLKPTVGYGGLDKFYAGCKADGIQPLVFVWVIGDDDGVKFLTTGVRDMYQNIWKTRQDGLNITREVARRARAAGVSPLIALNNEWNKGALQSSRDFAKFYDDQVSIIRTECPAAKIIFPPGAWGDLAALCAFYKPQVDKSDMVGLQCGYFRPRRSDDLALVGDVMARNFAKLPAGKPRILYDVFLSTYGGNFSTTHPFAGGDGKALEAQQAKAILGLGTIPNLTAVVYRDLRDNPTFDTKNYGGVAELFVGTIRSDGTKKPGFDALMSISKPAAAGRPATTAPSSPPPPDPCADVKSSLAASNAALAASQEALAAMKAERDTLLLKLAAVRSAVA